MESSLELKPGNNLFQKFLLILFIDIELYYKY